MTNQTSNQSEIESAVNEYLHQVCSFCGCNSPFINIFDQHLLTEELMATLTQNLGTRQADEPKSILISGGTIRPMIGGTIEPVEAIGIHGGKVIAIGSLASVQTVMNNQGIDYEKLELAAGQVLLPGLIEPHLHIVPSSLLTYFFNFGPYEGQTLRPDYDLNWLQNQIQAAATELKQRPLANQWLLAYQLDPALMPFEVLEPFALNKIVDIDYSFLDSIESEMPVLIISASGHTIYLNTPGLQIAYNKTPAIANQYGSFENFKQQTQGKLQESQTAWALKAALFSDHSQLSPQCSEMLLHSFSYLNNFFETLVSRGVTSVYDAGMLSWEKSLLELYLKFYNPKVRIGAAMKCLNEAQINELGKYQPVEQYHDVYIGHIKLVSDGSNQGLTGYQSSAYCCEPANNLGLFNFTESSNPNPTTAPPNFVNLVQTAINNGWPMMIHANGDQAVNLTISAYETALQGQDKTSLRNRIEHCSFMMAANGFSDLARLGISPSFLIGHVGYYGHVFRQAIFNESKAACLDLCQSSLNEGLRISLHSDYIVSPPGPLRFMEQSVTRVTEGNPQMKDWKTGQPIADTNVLNIDERLTTEQALRAVTYDAAWQCYADGWAGSLETGKFADFVILQQDPLNLKSVEQQYQSMRNIPVISTWKNGVKAYSS